jgi:hypothetical protein
MKAGSVANNGQMAESYVHGNEFQVAENAQNFLTSRATVGFLIEPWLYS